jgi:hypothetical protein
MPQGRPRHAVVPLVRVERTLRRVWAGGLCQLGYRAHQEALECGAFGTHRLTDRKGSTIYLSGLFPGASIGHA